MQESLYCKVKFEFTKKYRFAMNKSIKQKKMSNGVSGDHGLERKT